MNKNTKVSSIRDYRYRLQLIGSNSVQKLSLAFWVAITILQGAAISPFKEFKGLDDSYYWLISQSAKNLSIVQGEQFLTMGPLGFLDVADPTWHLGYSLSVLFKLTTALILWASINQRFSVIYKSYQLRYLSTTVVATFFSLVNPASINLAIGMFLYKQRNRLLEILSWSILLNILFFVKYLPFAILLMFYGIRRDLHKYLKYVVLLNIFITVIYISISGVNQFMQMLTGSFLTLNGYVAVSAENSTYINHYIYFLIFIVILYSKIHKQFNSVQKLALILIFYVIFKYGFTRHDVFHIIITFSVLLAISINNLYAEAKTRTHKLNTNLQLLTLIILCNFVFFSIHSESIFSISKYTILILVVTTTYVLFNRKYLLANMYFKYFSVILVATFAISGITPLNPVMPPVIKSSPFSINERLKWSLDSFESLLFNKDNELVEKYFNKKDSNELYKIISENDIEGNFMVLNYPIPLNIGANLVEFRPPINPVGAFTKQQDRMNLEWLYTTKLDWIFFDGNGIDPIQLLNQSPKFYSHIACNFSVYYTSNQYLILKNSGKDNCLKFKSTVISYRENSQYEINSKSFIYLVDNTRAPIVENIIKTLYKPLFALHYNNRVISLRNESEGDLIRIPSEIDFPGKFALNGDSLEVITLKKVFIFSN
jgi:hypothetical protein